MKIKFLGTSAGWPLPRIGCNCEICSSNDPKDKRTRTQVLVNDSILLDAGPDTYNHLANLDSSPMTQNDKIKAASKLKAILVSHDHLDHILGLWDVTHIYNLTGTLNVYVTLPVLNGIRKIVRTHGKNLKINIVKSNQSFSIDNIKAEYFPVIHGNTPTFGIKIKDKKILTYIPDLNRILPSQQKIIRDGHVLIIDGSSLNQAGQARGHISINDGIKISKNLKARKTYFVHIGHKTGTHQFLENYLAKNAGPNFHIAYDGLELEV